MKMINVFKLLSMYCICPECESDELGEDKGSLIVDEYTFHRKCKCGFDIIVDERNDEM
ncbi:DUF3797 domain-containing protein [Clostridioides difficile]|uniref:DUF3797 domain-containing protein n=1 Tax=Clostridioides difficile TaxID=1496 RepID=UPI000C9D1C23|nr:DUF3797 domain-containing protein [Clostridioides difficile]MBY1363235.1 DUF3797 domain-containing protein [Clostridioides difficile]MBY1861721.1 DUF3797 domain-containing protein [Clostridioides difficile]MBZ0925364.1 DUF3797 domain-containing protein [Clostridioides difficile]MCH7327583.1 DUF3797 domain-containing protein [Clostridioides difficile]MCJ1757333.1 DUF3797 domain-containing protein [Clostridioides difficile]